MDFRVLTFHLSVSNGDVLIKCNYCDQFGFFCNLSLFSFSVFCSHDWWGGNLYLVYSLNVFRLLEIFTTSIFIPFLEK